MIIDDNIGPDYGSKENTFQLSQTTNLTVLNSNESLLFWPRYSPNSYYKCCTSNIAGVDTSSLDLIRFGTRIKPSIYATVPDCAIAVLVL